MSALAHKVAIITGATCGIGYATAKLFAREGARSSSVRGVSACSTLWSMMQTGGHAVDFAGNVRDEEFAKALVDEAVGRYGGLDIAFNNPGTLGEMGATPDVRLRAGPTQSKHPISPARLGAKYSSAGDAATQRRVVDLHIDAVQLHAGMPGVAACRKQGGIDRPDPSVGGGIRAENIRVNAILAAPTRRWARK